MNQTDDAVQTNEGAEATRNDPAFEIIGINVATGATTIVIQKGIIGATANQLKTTSDRRKGASIVRKLGFVLSDCGDVQYGADVGETDLDPDLVTGIDYEEDVRPDDCVDTDEKE